MRNFLSILTGFLVGNLGGLMGLGGAEFRIPVLIYIFKFAILPGIVINLTVSFFTVLFSFIFRGFIVPFDLVFSYILIALNILMGSLIGSYVGVHFATSVNQALLKKIVAIFLIFVALILFFHDLVYENGYILNLQNIVRIPLGFVLGVFIGVFSSMLGVAGGELIIPTLLFIYNVDIKIAGSVSLMISLPTIIMGIYKYNKKGFSKVISEEKNFIFLMVIGSILGSLLGSFFLKQFSSHGLRVMLGVVLTISSLKMLYINKKN
ncbi:sulfite exporter TauE/SafE family protein [Calditerrivibrio nitroreducens]|uniref:Probable membrane transporter protein n=1 Tax=Calditerrivibrio nitroreducens (strain DSM 19672 / NBRC 101217 / Yu37-1) TaxID=768670 RepID=E4TES5_CALNY|nr:sulfite exporter TauE/SafE family protein [Calditerrivibrio nitroreducens]ADR19432.1 protein of unknown function DUF81 [Calditerrivibrio nitroreducens DSM 19672]